MTKKNDAVGTKYVLNSVAIFSKMVMDHLHFINMIYNRGRKKAAVPELVMRAGRFFKKKSEMKYQHPSCQWIVFFWQWTNGSQD